MLSLHLTSREADLLALGAIYMNDVPFCQDDAVTQVPFA